jgi:phosphoserine aminotransferase
MLLELKIPAHPIAIISVSFLQTFSKRYHNWAIPIILTCLIANKNQKQYHTIAFFKAVGLV